MTDRATYRYIGPQDELLLPLLHAGVVDAHDDAGPLDRGCGGHTRQRLAGTARQHDDAGARSAIAEHLRERFLLVRLSTNSGNKE